MERRRGEFPPSLLPCLAPEAVGAKGEDADENSVSTNSIAHLCSNDMEQFDTWGAGET